MAFAPASFASWRRLFVSLRTMNNWVHPNSGLQTALDLKKTNISPIIEERGIQNKRKFPYSKASNGKCLGSNLRFRKRGVLWNRVSGKGSSGKGSIFDLFNTALEFEEFVLKGCYTPVQFGIRELNGGKNLLPALLDFGFKFLAGLV